MGIRLSLLDDEYWSSLGMFIGYNYRKKAYPDDMVVPLCVGHEKILVLFFQTLAWIG